MENRSESLIRKIEEVLRIENAIPLLNFNRV
jgi:hypothetical protein